MALVTGKPSLHSKSIGGLSKISLKGLCQLEMYQKLNIHNFLINMLKTDIFNVDILTENKKEGPIIGKLLSKLNNQARYFLESFNWH